MRLKLIYVLFGCCSLLLTFGFAGCSSKPDLPALETHPVKGKVIYRNGQPFPPGMIEFRPAEGTGVGATGEISEAGEFSLSTLREDGSRLPGAQVGSYHAILIPPMSEQQTEVPVELRDVFKVEAKENEITIVVP